MEKAKELEEEKKKDKDVNVSPLCTGFISPEGQSCTNQHTIKHNPEVNNQELHNSNSLAIHNPACSLSSPL